MAVFIKPHYFSIVVIVALAITTLSAKPYSKNYDDSTSKKSKSLSSDIEGKSSKSREDSVEEEGKSKRSEEEEKSTSVEKSSEKSKKNSDSKEKSENDKKTSTESDKSGKSKTEDGASSDKKDSPKKKSSSNKDYSDEPYDIGAAGGAGGQAGWDARRLLVDDDAQPDEQPAPPAPPAPPALPAPAAQHDAGAGGGGRRHGADKTTTEYPKNDAGARRHAAGVLCAVLLVSVAVL